MRKVRKRCMKSIHKKYALIAKMYDSTSIVVSNGDRDAVVSMIVNNKGENGAINRERDYTRGRSIGFGK